MTIVTQCGQKENVDQMWPKKIAPHGRTCHKMDSDQMWSKYCPSSEDFVTQRTFDQMWSRIFAPYGGLCHTADSDQMWSIVFVVERIIHHIQLLPNKTNIQWPSTVKYLKIPKMNKTNTRVRDRRENSRHYYRNHGDSKKKWRYCDRKEKHPKIQHCVIKW